MQTTLTEWPIVVRPTLPQFYCVQRVENETQDTFTLDLTSLDGQDLRFAPGQFNMLYMFGMGELPIPISGDPARPQVLTHTIRATGTVTKAIHNLKRGNLLGVRGPFGSSWPVEKASGSDVLLVAGGIGLASLRPVLYQLLANRNDYGKIALLYGARTPGDMLYAHELEEWQSRLDLKVKLTVDSAKSNWRGNVGAVTNLIPKVQFDPTHTTAMICGPEVMMRFTIMELQRRGLASENIYVSLERHMKCSVGMCGHYQSDPASICKDGPMFRFDHLDESFRK